MAGQPRQPFKVFGSAGVISAPTAFAKFGSLAAGDPIRTTDIATIMSLPAWGLGVQAALYEGNDAFALEDDNSWRFVHSYQIGQLFQDGIPQWQVAQVYQVGSWVQDNAGLGQVFQCLAANTVGGSLPVGASSSAWLWVNPPLATVTGAPAAGSIPKITGAAGVGPAGSYALAQGLLSDDGVNVKIGTGTDTSYTKGLMFPDGTVQKTATGGTIAQYHREATYAFNQPARQNAGSRPIYVSISATLAYTNTVLALCDSDQSLVNASNPSTTVASSYASIGGASVPANLFFIVPPGYWYRVVVTNATLRQWTEWS